MLEESAATATLTRRDRVFDLKAPAASGGTYDIADNVVIRTPEAPWAYAVQWDRSDAGGDVLEDVLISVRARAREGRFGILVWSGDTVLAQVPFDESDGWEEKDIAIRALGPGSQIIIRNYDIPGTAVAEIESLEVRTGYDPKRARDPNYRLTEVSNGPFKPKLHRKPPFVFGSIATTEVCNLSCVMCHFNGPKALKKGKRLSPETVRTILDQLPAGEETWFAATGEFFVDPHALEHLEEAVNRGLVVGVLSHGQFYDEALLDKMLDIGVSIFRMSADSIDAAQFRKIRRGGELQKIIDAAAYLRKRKAQYPHIRCEVSCTLFSNTFERQQEFEAFWSDKVDRMLFNAEYYDSLKFRNIMHQPKKRVNCEVRTFVVPSGHIAPCCAMMVAQHDNDTSWLPHVDTHTLEEAYTELCDMYEREDSPLAKICSKCEWWIMWAQNQSDVGSAYCRWVDFSGSQPEPDGLVA